MAYRCGTTEAKNIIKRRKECVGPSFHAVLVEPCDMGPLPLNTWNGTCQIQTGQHHVEIEHFFCFCLDTPNKLDHFYVRRYKYLFYSPNCILPPSK